MSFEVFTQTCPGHPPAAFLLGPEASLELLDFIVLEKTFEVFLANPLGN